MRKIHEKERRTSFIEFYTYFRNDDNAVVVVAAAAVAAMIIILNIRFGIVLCDETRNGNGKHGTKFVCAVHSTKTGGWYATCRHASAKLCVVSTFFSCHSRYVDCCCCCRRYCCVAYEMACVCECERVCELSKSKTLSESSLSVFGFGCHSVRARCVRVYVCDLPRMLLQIRKRKKETIFRSHRRCKMFLQWFRCCYCRRSHVKILLLHARERALASSAFSYANRSRRFFRRCRWPLWAHRFVVDVAHCQCVLRQCVV